MSAAQSAAQGPVMWLPQQASTIAGQSDAVLIAWIVVSVLVTGAIVGVMLFFGVRYRRGSPADRTPLNERTALKIEIIWLIPTAAVFIAFFFWGGYVYYQAYTPPVKDILPINAVGKQWMWKFQHPDGILEFNDLHVPVGRKVVLTMTSEDVVHSLSLPAFRVKKDVIPGTYTQLWLEATQPGEFHLFCTQYCGLNHSRMRGRVIVMTPTDYQGWLNAQRPAARPAEAGKLIYQTYGCDACHGPNANAHAPALAGLYGSQVHLKDGASVLADDAYLRDAILDPNKQVVAGYQPIMPAYKGQIDEEGIFKLIAYLKSLAPEGKP